MVNDTNTLNGALTELGETMADNLVTMGVTDATASDGLTTLANKILEIPVTPIAQTLTLTSDKDILSYYDGDSCTLTATLSGGDVSGKTVEFFNGSTSLGTALTNANGVATKTYQSQGIGDISITASVGSISSETYSIEDCIIYDSLTSASGKWTIPSGVTSVYSDEGWKISANAYKQIKLTEKLTSESSVEFTLEDYYSSNMSSYAPVIVYQYANGETTPNQELLMNTSSSSFRAVGTTINHAMVKGAVYRIEYTSSTIKIYEDDTLLASANNSVGLPTRFEWHMGANSRYAVYKDLKVKPL